MFRLGNYAVLRKNFNSEWSIVYHSDDIEYKEHLKLTVLNIY